MSHEFPPFNRSGGFLRRQDPAGEHLTKAIAVFLQVGWVLHSRLALAHS